MITLKGNLQWLTNLSQVMLSIILQWDRTKIPLPIKRYISPNKQAKIQHTLLRWVLTQPLTIWMHMDKLVMPLTHLTIIRLIQIRLISTRECSICKIYSQWIQVKILSRLKIADLFHLWREQQLPTHRQD